MIDEVEKNHSESRVFLKTRGQKLNNEGWFGLPSVGNF